MKLYELTNEYQQILDLAENDDIPEDVIADTLEAINAEIEVKADNIACLLKDISADIGAMKAEEERLSERRKRKQAIYDRLKDYLSSELLKANMNEIESARNKITFRKSESVEITIDEDRFIEWAEEFRDDLLSYSAPKINRTALKAAIKDGTVTAGARIIEKQNIQIK